MSEILDELKEIETRASAIYSKWCSDQVTKTMEQLISAANEMDLAHSGSWLGYHALVYYNNMEKPPPGAIFDRQWGLRERYSGGTVGDWVQYSYSDIYEFLKGVASEPSYEQLMELVREAASEFDDLREDLLSVIEVCRAVGGDEYLDRMKKEANEARMTSSQKFAMASAPPPPPFTNDMTAVAGGTAVPPHAAFRATLYSARSLFNSADDLAKIAKRTAKYLSRQAEARGMLMKNQSGTRVFIGHGRSSAWLELKNYIQDRLGVQCDDFNRQATAGHTTVARLSTMLTDACFALLVLTAEDEQEDGKVHARQNVVHEAGLFQGKLGFEKAIVMLESGCEEFSNIHGLGQIRFDKGKISSSFHEVSDTLKREGII